MGENEASKKGLRFKIKYENTSDWTSSKRVGENCSGYKVLIEEESGQILGAHILGHHAEEFINIFSMAIRLGHTAEEAQGPSTVFLSYQFVRYRLYGITTRTNN